LFGRDLTVDNGALGLGILGLVRILPIIIFALWGGIMADTHDRRKLMMWTQGVSTLVAVTLATLTLSGQVTLVFIYVLTAIGSAARAFDSPARSALIPNLVPARDLTNALSLDTLVWKIGTVVGPALAGVLVGVFDVGVVYALDALSFVAVFIALILMSFRGRPDGGTQLSWQAVVDGLRFTFQTRLIWSTMLLDFLATFFASARTLLPIVATEMLGVGVEGYGLLATAEPAGAFVAGFVLSVRRNIRRQGMVLLGSVAVYGLATALFGLSTIFVLSYSFFWLTGVADTVSTVIRNVIRQLNTPDYLRGRMTSVNMMFFMGGPQLGDLEAGLIAAFLGAPFAIVSGGLATVLLTGWVAWKYPRLRNYVSKP
jgi:MFS family permease